MYEFSLLKSLYHELDPFTMKEATEVKEKDKTFRTLEVSFEEAPEVTAITAEERKLPYLVRYYLYLHRDGERELTELKERTAQEVVYAFYRKYFPGYLKEGLPEKLDDRNVLDCFEVFKMPSYRPDYAFPGLVRLEDMRAGKVKFDKPQFAFPGLELITNRKPRDPDKPSISDYDGYESFDGDKKKANQKLELLKRRFASQVKELNGGALPENFESEAFSDDDNEE